MGTENTVYVSISPPGNRKTACKSLASKLNIPNANTQFKGYFIPFSYSLTISFKTGNATIIEIYDVIYHRCAAYTSLLNLKDNISCKYVAKFIPGLQSDSISEPPARNPCNKQETPSINIVGKIIFFNIFFH